MHKTLRREEVKILILNRRDIANPAGGGAEIYTHEIAAGLAGKYECEVVVFSCSFRESSAEDIIDRVQYVRRGNEATVHLWGFLYALRNRDKFDYIIDEFNGMGFFTFFLKNSLLLIHQMYREFWFRELGPAGIIPFMLEPLLLKLYRKKTAITVSPSTRDDLMRLGFKQVRIVMNALARPFAESGPKDTVPTLVFLGRLRSTKRPEDALKIFRRVKEQVPSARLWIIGAGPLEGRLKDLASGLADVTFWGFVSGEQKMGLLARAHLLVVPSVREGFGINVIEAASAGCPSVGYNVAGLRDSIRHGETGYLADSADEAAAKAIGLLADPAAFERLSNNCLDYAKEFDWARRVDEFWEIIRGEKE